ncbi:hypothetical protein [Chitinophaga silvisoli]|nr:hypothetical protein [Chitinophaga silvisoli]
MNLHLLTDDLLRRLFQASDEHAFRELYQRYFSSMKPYLWLRAVRKVR